MGDYNRQRILFFRTDVNKMDVQPIDLGDELRIAIELRLDLAPVVFRRPIAGELLHRRERHALREIGDGLFFGPPRRFDPLAEIREVLVRGVKLEGADGVCCGLSWGVERRHGAGHCGLLPKGAAVASSTRLHAPAAAVVTNLRGVMRRSGFEVRSVYERGRNDRRVSRSEEHTSELQSRGHLVCRLLLEKKKKTKTQHL